MNTVLVKEIVYNSALVVSIIYLLYKVCDLNDSVNRLFKLVMLMNKYNNENFHRIGVKLNMNPVDVTEDILDSMSEE